MRKGLNKKGFSLVELMIVVVIMGILVAVAIPLYNAVTDNAEAKSCGSNQRIIRGAFANWVLMDDVNNTGDTLFLTTSKTFNGKTQNAEDVFAPEFLDRFDDGKLPSCPDDNSYYVITKVDDNTIKIECYDENGNLRDKHTSD